MFKWFKKKNKVMTEQDLMPLREELSQVPKFQWVKTDKAGRVTQFKDVVLVKDMILVEFTDGSRVKYDMLGDAVMKILDDSMLLEINGEVVDNGQSLNVPPPTVNIGTPRPQASTNPVHALLAKQKTNPVPVEISIEMNLPPVSLYKVLAQSFDNADSDIVDFIVQDLDVPMIREAVREAITNFYTENNGSEE